MITRIRGDRRAQALTRRVDRPQAILLAVAQAAIATAGWLLDPFWVAVAVAAQLALGGFGAVRLIGPARPGLGFARYATPAMAGIAATLFGRLLPGGVALLLVPLMVVLLWAVIYLELRAGQGAGGTRTLLDLLMTGILFAGSAGIFHLLGGATWPPPLVLVAAIALVLSVRGAEGRGAAGAEAIGLGLLQVVAVAQVGAAVVLLDLPGVVAPAIIALAFHAWGGAAEALENGARTRDVAVEFGLLAVIGLGVALALARV
jgi:hypothetical protein